MKQGDKVYLLQRGQWFEYTFIATYPQYAGSQWEDTVQVKNGLGPFTCKASELITKEAYDKMIYEARREELHQEHYHLIELWGNGPEKPSRASRRRLVVKCAHELGCSASGLGRTLAMLGRYGLIKYDKEPGAEVGTESSSGECERASGLPDGSEGL